MKPYDYVRERYTLPFDFYPFQVDAVNECAPLPRCGIYLEPGLGKTAVATAIALYRKIMGRGSVVVCLMPPLLVTQWGRWLSQIKSKDGTPLRVTRYQGSPAHRKTLPLAVDFLLMGVQIFKQDFGSAIKTRHGDELSISMDLGGSSYQVILDEAHCIKDVGSAIYGYYKSFVQEVPHQLLTGTPLNKPEDAYAYINLVTPGLYRNLNHFNTLHVTAEKYHKPCAYDNLDLIHTNLLVNSVRKTKEEVLIDLPEAIITDVQYDLDGKHYALYRQLATDRLLLLKDDMKLDVTQVTALRHALGQIVCQWHYFGQDEKLKSRIYTLIEGLLDELGSKKLIIFSNYQRTNEEIVRRFKCPGIWGAVPPKLKLKNLARFLDDDKCRLIAMHPVAAGQGIDGCQHVCTDVLYAEPPITPSHLTQSLSRVHRQGQTRSVTVRMAVASGTLQRHDVNRLTKSELLINPLQGSKTYLTPEEVRYIIFGGE